jgi:hypothetical protein
VRRKGEPSLPAPQEDGKRYQQRDGAKSRVIQDAMNDAVVREQRLHDLDRHHPDQQNQVPAR